MNTFNKRIEEISTKQFEVVTTILLAIASLFTAWGGYQASQWGSVQSISLSQASTRRTQASQAATASGQNRLLDITAYMSWLEANADQDTALATYYQERFSAPLTAAFDAWIATKPLVNRDAPESPFDMPAYRPPKQLEAEALEAEADALFAKGSTASDVSSGYVRASLFIASSLFFAAISKSFEVLKLRVILLVVSALLLVLGVLSIVSLPIA